MRIDKPVVVYDAECDFCRRKADEWRIKTGDDVIYMPYEKQIFDAYPDLTQERCREAVHVIMPDDQIYSGARAVFHILDLGGKGKGLLWSYEHVPFFKRLSEWGYRMVAKHRKKL